ncbi:MAG: M10 family metallopeptidase C-terminal domain-containing protein [Alphaproteobacteria bacterium]|nr:M10 family metallopeptidase C-terminal domain-containing protein [Alphaproteobacteria bacterium]
MISYVSDETALYIDPVYARFNNNAALGTPGVVSYWFADSADPDFLSRGYTQFQPFNASYRAAVEQVFAFYSEIANLTFVEVTDPADATLSFGVYEFDASEAAGAAAVTYINWSVFAPEDPANQYETYILVDDDEHAVAPQLGNFEYLLLLHEIGHALGLDHPFEGTVQLLPQYDNYLYTVMSYDDVPGLLEDPSTAMPLDIAALQTYYGANGSTRSGDTTYFNDGAATESVFGGWTVGTYFVLTVWDGGGIDTFDLSNKTQSLLIDLNEGAYSRTGAYMSPNLAIAHGTVIENAVGGSRSDYILGNDVANWLRGNDGDDTILGGQGDDSLLGEDGSDHLDAGDGIDTVYGSVGVDTLVAKIDGAIDLYDGGADTDILQIDPADIDNDIMVDLIAGTLVIGVTEADDLIGIETFAFGAGNDVFTAANPSTTVNAGNGDNTLTGGRSRDFFTAGSGNDSMDGGDGDDVLSGGDGDDTLVGGFGNDSLTALAGANFLYGGRGFDTLSGSGYLDGGEDQDLLTGLYTDDTLLGGDSNDALWGGDGDDSMDAGTGDDVVYLSPGNDTADGGAGIDRLDYHLATTGVVINLATGIADGGPAWGLNVISNFEWVSGGQGDDWLIGDGGDNTLVGGVGVDTMDGGVGIDTAIFRDYGSFFSWVSPELNTGEAAGDVFVSIERIVGRGTFEGDGDDNWFVSLGGPSLFEGFDGNDTLEGGSGDETLLGGNGDDFLHPGADQLGHLDGGAGTNWLYIPESVGFGNTAGLNASLNWSGVTFINVENLKGNSYGNRLDGDDDDNILDGGDGDDTFWGFGGADTMIGGDGDDSLNQFGLDSIDGGNGADRVIFEFDFGSAQIFLDGSAPNGGAASGIALENIEHVQLRAGDDYVVGNGSDNVLDGSSGNDTLIGRGGDDELWGAVASTGSTTMMRTPPSQSSSGISC